MAENPLWGDDWMAVREQWVLDPDVVHLNHGSFGACPRPVLDRQSALRSDMERGPVDFLDRRLPGLLAGTREQVAAFLGADPSGLLFVPNATTGVATVLASLDLRPDDRIVVTDHAYPAVRNAVGRARDRWGVQILVRHVPVPLPAPADVVEAILGGLGGRPRVVIVDHVTSPTAVIFPVEAIVTACREAGIPVLVDGAHAPGMLPVDLHALDPDFWTGNFHKWVCSPKGAAGLWVGAAHRRRIVPLVTSHGFGGSLHQEFDWQGTDDPTAILCVPAAIEFMGALGWDRVRAHNHDLVELGRRMVAASLGTTPPVPEDQFGSMAVVETLPGTITGQEVARALSGELFRRERIEVPFTLWNERGFLRLSAQVYNRPQDYERLAGALPAFLEGTGAIAGDATRPASGV